MASCPVQIHERPTPHPPWSQLPTELLELVARKLAGDISDFIRFRCVCRSWRLAGKPSDLSPQLPWLLLPYDPESSTRSFFSFATESTRTLVLPETRNRSIVGSSNGWLLMVDIALQFSLFNPLTRSLVRLPPVTSLPEDCFVFELRRNFAGNVYIVNINGDEVTLEEITVCIDYFAFVSPDPGEVIDGIVAFNVREDSRIQYCRTRGDAGWTVIDSGLVWTITTMAYHNGKFYLIDSKGNTAVCDVGPTTQNKAMVIPSLKLELTHSSHPCSFLVTFCEELLVVTCYKYYVNGTFFLLDEMIFEYHKLEEANEGKMTWSRLPGIGDCTAFLIDGVMLSKGRSMSIASNASGYKSNFLYFVVPLRHIVKGLSGTQVFMVSDGDIVPYYGPCSYLGPELMSSVWIVPSLG